MQLNSQLLWEGLIYWMGNHHLVKIILRGELSIENCNRGSPSLEKNPLVPVILTVANCPPKLRTISPPTILSPPLKTLKGLLSRTKCTGRGNTILRHQAWTRPSAVVAVNVLSCSALGLSTTNVPAVSVKCTFLIFTYIANSIIN